MRWNRHRDQPRRTPQRESEGDMGEERRERYAEAEHEARELVERCRRRVVELAETLQACDTSKPSPAAARPEE